MKKITGSLFIVILLAGGISSCNQDFLDTQPLDQVSSDLVWKDAALATAFVNGVYNDNNTQGLGMGGFDEQMLASLSDEAVFTHAGRGINTINEGLLSPSNTGRVNNTYDWNVMFKKIRAANSALENLAIATFEDTALNSRLRGEVHFLRGYYYQQLLRYYGAVPIISKTYGLGEDYSAPRNTYEECVNFIISDCDSAALLLEGKAGLGKGRATTIAALALKSRVLLYAASDLHDVPTAKSKSATIASYANPEYLGYISGDRTARCKLPKMQLKQY